ncbi:MAG: ferritin family protein [Myxococcales bacterium]|nr:ferritin family protein [Myxococcales bacterium]
MDEKKALEYALQREKEGHRFFSQHAQAAQHAAVKAVFERLAKEEEGHIRYVQNLLDRCCGKQAAKEDAVQHDAGFFSQRAASEMIEQTTAQAMVPDLPVLRMAFLIERDLQEFYTAAAKQSSGAAKKALEKLAAWEGEHARLFQSLHDQIMKEYAGMAWGG